MNNLIWNQALVPALAIEPPRRLPDSLESSIAIPQLSVPFSVD